MFICVGRGCWGDQLRRVEHSYSDTLIRADHPPPLQQYCQTNSFNNQGWMLDSRKCLIQSYFFPGPWFRVVLSFVNFKSDKAIIFFNSIPFTPFQSLDGKYKVQKIPNFVLWMLFHVLLVYKHGWIHYNPIKDCIQFMFIWIAANIYAFVELECGWEWMRQATTMTEINLKGDLLSLP